MRSCARSSTAAPLAGVELRLIARNNEVLATQDDRRRRPRRFRPRPVARDRRPRARRAGGDAGRRLRLPQPDAAGVRSHRPRRRRPRRRRRALDAFLYTERGVYRSGETVYVAALLRDAKGVAEAGLPLTLVVKRPDGVEYKRATVADQGLGGRALSVPLATDAARRHMVDRRLSPTRRRPPSATRNSCSRTTCRSASTIN